MSVTDPKYIVQYIQNWITDYLKQSDCKNIIIAYWNTCDCTLIINICKQIQEPILIDQKDFKMPLEAAVTLESRRNNALIVSSLTRDDINLVRNYNKYGERLADIFPLGDLYYSEVITLMKYFNIELNEHYLRDGLAKNLTHIELEWADRENNQTNIITREEAPNTYKFWYKYTIRQKEIVSKLYQIEKKTRHKKIDGPICKVRHLIGYLQ